ncbi:barstar family protein [Dyadobacter sandarakinus]|uniref:Barstar family protein n=1 Tax=Dyadobacter sandarakinus TaxID=2747268 RepID=A0ABX7IB67_9BACT|nr:barstar family protein [Dyadobacter sandarakinus]QRR02968.1 barstar family protein [Dyadobacter sandarakinus]
MKNTHFLIAGNESEISTSFIGAFVADIDGKKSLTIRDFHEQLASALNFPEYEGRSLEDLDEMLNDLQWIEEKKIIIYISDTAEWLSKEKSEDKILTVIDMFDATAEDWRWLDEDEQDGFKKKELRIVFQDSARIRRLLEEQEIPFGTFD